MPEQIDSGESFDIHASVVFQLGETLITDEIQALMELVKNSYDANATRCRVTVDTESGPPLGSVFPDARGFISVDDDGDGMDRATIKRGWLTISNSIKREIKKHPLPSDKRTPLGDKGLGRLGAQRLGYNIEIWTRPGGTDVEYHVSFSWRDFADKQSIFDVSAIVTEIVPASRKSGTRIVISDLRDPPYWLNATEELQTNLSQMISPYGEVANFRVSVEVNGQNLDLARLATEIRQTAELHYDLAFDGDEFTSIGRARLAFFRPERKEGLAIWSEFVEKDAGEDFFRFLETRPIAKDIHLCRGSEAGWFIDYSFSRKLAGLSSLELDSNGSIANPGPFRGEVDSFDLGAESAARQNVFNKAAEYRQFVTQLSGIRVYRDGFGIRVDQDWLRLGAQWTSARSYYGLKPQNVMGYIAISARNNAALEETTDREGFVDNSYFRNFYEIMRQWVDFTNRVQNFFRRGWLEYEVARSREVTGVPDQSPEELSRSLSDNLAIARQSVKPLTQLANAIEKTVADARETVKATEQTSLFTMSDAERAQIEKSVSAFEKSASESQTIIAQVGDVVANLSYQEALGRVITRQVDALREQIAEVYETVSLGLTAEALSHEIHHVADDLALQTRRIRQVLQRRKIVVAELIAYLERVDSAVSALLKQLSHLSPSLRYVREKREVIVLSHFFQEQNEFFAARFAKRNIRLEVNARRVEDLSIYMNKGKLVQIVDNIFLNSEYWLREEMRLGHISEGIITVELARPFFRVYDNGPGIDPSVEHSLFEAFVTMKGKGKGRGLGLFIVQQLLDSEGCTISLSPERNEQGHLYKFEIDLSAALNKKASDDKQYTETTN